MVQGSAGYYRHPARSGPIQHRFQSGQTGAHHTPIGTPDVLSPPATWVSGGNSFHGQVAAALRLVEGERSVAAVAGSGGSERHRYPTQQRLPLGFRLSDCFF